MISRVSSVRRGFLVSASFPIAALLIAQPVAAQVVVNSATTSTVVNGQIAAAIAASRDVSVNVTTDGVVTGPPNVQFFSAGGGKGDGAITLTNAGSLGAVSADGTTVTNSVGATLFGAGPATKDNTAAVTNTGLITNGVTAINYGSDVTVTNNGTIFGGITANGYGNVVVTTGGVGGAGGQLRTGNINANALTTSTSAAITGGTKTTSTAGTTKVVVASDVGTAASKGSINAFSATDASVTISALAGSVFAGGANTNTTTQSAPAAAGKAVQTSANTVTYNPGNAAIAVLSGGNVDSVQTSGVTNSTISVASGGKIGTVGAFAGSSAGNDSTSKVTTTQNDAGVTTQTLFESTSTARGPAAKISVDAGGSIGGAAGASGLTSAAVANAGTITGTTSANSIGTSSTNANTVNYTDAGVLASQRVISTQAAAGGTASVDVAKGGASQGSVSANGDGGASITNAGTIGVTATPVAVTASSARSLQILNDVNTTYAPDGFTVATRTTNVENKTVGAAASVTNTADGLISTTGLSANAVGPVTLANAGVVRGATSGSSAGTDILTVGTFTNNSTATTTASSQSTTSTTTQIGGSVTGTYSGVNGTVNSFTPVANGSISQFATTDSVATISGTIYGSVQSSGGSQGSNSTSVNKTDSSDPISGTGTRTSATTGSFNSTQVAGTGTVSVTGKVALGDAGVTPTVTATGTKAAVATITNGTLEGNLVVNAPGIQTFAQTTGNSYSQAVVAATPTSTTALTNSTTNKTTYTDGVATATLTGTTTTGSKTNGAVSVTGNTATATVGVGAKVGTTALPAGLSVAANTFDTSNSDAVTYSRDPATTTTTATGTTASTSTPTATAGNATATVAGWVTGATTASASGGNATATINGNTGSVSANASGTNFATTTTNTYSGKTAGTTATTFTTASLDATLSGIKTAQTTTSTSTPVGGKATVLIDSSDAVKAASASASPNNIGVAGSATASGVGGATVTVTSGSLVGGTVSANSLFTGSNSKTTNSYAAGVLTTQTTTATNSVVGGAATVTNAGGIANNVFATGATSAEIANSGKLGTVLGGNVFSANALGLNTATTFTDTTITNAAQRTQVTKAVQTASGGTAKFSNSAAGVVLGSVSLAGGTGTFSNDGTITGTTTLGQAVNDYTLTTTKTATGTTTVVTQPTTLFTQTYTANQNGTSGGFNVTGATIVDPSDATKTLQTSNVNATVNLNSGSVTLGAINAQTDAKTAARLTNTVVNLNGSGYLGLDAAIPTPNTLATSTIYTPEATLTKDATTYLGSAPLGVTVSGVTALNKTGAGTFVITGVPYSTSTTAGVQPSYSLNVGAFNINGGEVQLAVVGGTPVLPIAGGYTTGGAIDTGLTTTILNSFGIKGDVNNNATLVIGRRVSQAASVIGGNLTGNGEHVAGTTLVVNGNYTQGAAGTTVVGLTPSLVRTVPLTILPTGTATDTLGVVTPSVTVGYFTTVPNAVASGLYTGSANSKINVTGNVTLAGNVLVDASRDGLYANGDGATLFTYTGTADTSKATATSSLNSQFVKFALVNDVNAKTVSLSATRSSFTTGATNPNAAAAAVGLDSAITTIVDRIRSDASGGAAFTSVSQIGYAQDLANIVSALDWRLTSAQAAEVFDELSSAEVYGSLSAVNQNVIFGDTVNQLSARRTYGEALGTRLWLTPSGNFARYGRTGSGASPIRVNSYGGAGGFDFAYSHSGAFGIGAAYGEHRINARGTPEKGTAKTWTVGAYVTQSFGPFYVNGQFAYGFSRFDIDRTLPLLARTINGRFHGTQVDASLEGGYDFDLNGVFVTPFAKAAVRHYSLNSFTETNGGGAGLNVAGRSKSIFSPTIGVKVGATYGDAATLALRPFAKASYTFQGDIGSDRTVSYLGGGSAFVLRGVDPGHYGTIEAGLDALFSTRVNVFLSGGYSFGGGNKVGSVKAGVGFKF